jgi:hypothetical protein
MLAARTEHGKRFIGVPTPHPQKWSEARFDGHKFSQSMSHPCIELVHNSRLDLEIPSTCGSGAKSSLRTKARSMMLAIPVNLPVVYTSSSCGHRGLRLGWH